LARWVILGLLLLIAVLQWRLWTQPGGMPEVSRLELRVREQQMENRELKRRNESLAADVQDLKEGKDAVEERARAELGMIKSGEVFYQVVEPERAARPEGSESQEGTQ
jgi:cell division protein FtsB